MSRDPLFTAFRVRSLSRARLTTVLAVVLALGLLAGRVDAQSTGSITGTATNAGTGAPLPLPWPDALLSLEDILIPRGGPWSASVIDGWSPGSSLRPFDELRVAPSDVEGRLRSGQAVRSPGALAPGASDPGIAVRQAPATYVPTVPLKVTLTVTPDGDVQTWALEETVPAGWMVSAVSAEGYWDEKAGVVRWGPFFDEAPQTLRYALTPPAGASGPQELGGTASFDGVDVVVTGARTLQRAPITRPGDPGVTGKS